MCCLSSLGLSSWKTALTYLQEEGYQLAPYRQVEWFLKSFSLTVSFLNIVSLELTHQTVWSHCTNLKATENLNKIHTYISICLSVWSYQTRAVNMGSMFTMQLESHCMCGGAVWGDSVLLKNNQQNTCLASSPGQEGVWICLLEGITEQCFERSTEKIITAQVLKAAFWWHTEKSF